ncbi:MAG TPA: alpha/beta hydrolase [Polyangiales bacterium]|jgi:pimeloyl-ACP methyl ester carboxylesterase|nr:alpha/beta hydrolase [Polyangiales bacterium]
MATVSVLSTVGRVAKDAALRLRHHLHERKSSGFTWPLQAAIEAERHVIATSDAGAISYYEDTSGEGRPLVLLHGIHAAGSAFEVRTLFYEFRGERPVYAVDLPGFGFSQRGGMPYTPKTYVHAIEHVLRHIAVESPDGRADIIALSLSSEYAARVAADLPDLVHSLVLISPTGFERLAQGDRQRNEPPALLKSVARMGGELFYDALVTRPSLTHYLAKSFAGKIDRGLLEYSHSTSHQPGAQYAPLAFVSGELFPSGDPKMAYERVKAPALVIYDEDPYVSFGGLRAFVIRNPSYRAERVSHTRGLPHIEARERTMRVIRAFFDKLEAEDAGEQRRFATRLAASV